MFNTKGACARQILFDVKDGVVTELKFVGGCNGNANAISRFVVGRRAEDVIPIIKGIQCRNNTSCPDQLAIALESYCQTGGVGEKRD
jgi:uncharacterized protein (TIGR03905 family)